MAIVWFWSNWTQERAKLDFGVIDDEGEDIIELINQISETIEDAALIGRDFLHYRHWKYIDWERFLNNVVKMF